MVARRTKILSKILGNLHSEFFPPYDDAGYNHNHQQQAGERNHNVRRHTPDVSSVDGTVEPNHAVAQRIGSEIHDL
jgi:hypothetical protein